jgi:superfamily I DNA and RNA helicase
LALTGPFSSSGYNRPGTSLFIRSDTHGQDALFVYALDSKSTGRNHHGWRNIAITLKTPSKREMAW